jgi:hypothetical protein
MFFVVFQLVPWSMISSWKLHYFYNRRKTSFGSSGKMRNQNDQYATKLEPDNIYPIVP